MINDLKKKSIVYIFTNGCDNDTCKPLDLINQYAISHNFKLYLIMTSYYRYSETTAQNIELPLFAIDSDYYQEKKTRKYLKRFKSDIGYFQFSKNKKYVGNFIIYQNDSIIDIKTNL